MSDPSIVEKIRKLLALSKSDNIHEAAAAAERAHKLMLEHSIALDDVSDILPEDIVEDAIVDDRMRAVWRFGLLTACARSYYCSTVRVEEVTQFGLRPACAVIMGRKDDVAAVRCLFEFFETEIERLYGTELFPDDLLRTQNLKSLVEAIEAGESWKRGAVVAIQDKLRGQRVMFERENEKAMALGDKARAAVSKYQMLKYPETYRPDMISRSDRAFEKGYRAGLNVAVPGKGSKRLEDK